MESIDLKAGQLTTFGNYFKNSGKAAGARARKAALELMKDLKDFRKVSVEEAKK